MKISSHVLYLAALTVVCYVAIVNIMKVNEIQSGKSMYFANVNELQNQLSKSVQKAIDANVNKTDYASVVNEIITSGKIKIIHNGIEIRSVQFSSLKQTDGVTTPYVSMNFSTPMEYFGKQMDGVSFVYREGVQFGYVSKSVKDDKSKE